MKTKLILIVGILVMVGVALVPTASARNTNAGECAFENADCASSQMQQNGNRTGPRDGSKGENAPRDGRGKGNGNGPRDGSGNGARRGQGGGPRDGSGPGCQKS